MSKESPYDPFTLGVNEDFKEIVAHYLVSPSRLLDVGAGDGRNAIYLAKSGHRVTGIDLDEDAVEHARASKSFALPQINEAGGRLSFEIADVRHRLFFGEVFDMIFAHYVMQELESRDEISLALENMREATVPGGLNSIITNVEAHPDQKKFPGIKILDTEEVALKYESVGWDVVHLDENPLRDPIEINGKPYSRSFEHTVVRKPE